MNIKLLQAIDLEKINIDSLKDAVKSILSDYNQTKDKASFEEIGKDNIIKVYKLVKRVSPDAIKTDNNPKKISSNNEKSSDIKKKVHEDTRIISIKEDLEALDQDIKACRAKIRKYNEEKKKGQSKRPKPTRHGKIKGHFISISNLIPPTLKNNKTVQKEARKILLKAHRGIMNAYRMNDLNIKKGQEHIEEKYDKILENNE